MVNSLDSYNTRKKVVRIALIIIIAAAIALFVIPIAKADSHDGNLSHYDGLIEYYNEYYKPALTNELNDGMFSAIDTIFGKNGGTSTLMLNRFFEGIKTTLENSDIFHSIGTSVAALAAVIVIITAFGALFHELQRGEPTIEMWTHCFLILAVGMVIIINWELIMNTAADLGEVIVDLVRKGISSSDTEVNGIEEFINSHFALDYQRVTLGSVSITHFVDWLSDLVHNIKGDVIAGFKMIELTFVFIALEIPLLGARIVLLTILIEMMLRKAFFPLAIADICSQGMRSSGVVYIKKYIALWIRVGMCLIISVACKLIIGGINDAWVSIINNGENNLIIGAMALLSIYISYKTCAKMFANTAGLAGQVLGV